MEGSTAEWFAEHRGLRNDGVDVRSLTNHDVPLEDINGYFGPKHGKNGWIYNAKTSLEDARKILALYQRVTGEERVLNKQLTLTFARAIVAECKKIRVNWASYAAYLQRFRVEVRNTKAASMKRRLNEGPQLQLLETLLPVAPSRSVFLSVKSEVTDATLSLRGRGSTGGPKSKNSGNVSICPPNWTDSEMERVREFLSSRKDVCDKINSTLGELCSLKEKAECDLRLSRLQLSDRKVVSAQSRLDLENVIVLLQAARTDFDVKSVEFASFELQSDEAEVGASQLNLQILRDEVQKASSKVNECERQKFNEEKNDSFAEAKLKEFEAKCKFLSENVAENTKTFEEKSAELKSLLNVIYNRVTT